MLPSLTLAAVLDSLVKLFAIIGGVSVALSPLLLAYVKLRVHDAVKDAPALLETNSRVDRVERWQSDHAEDVRLIPRIAATLDRVDQSLGQLTKAIIEKGLS